MSPSQDPVSPIPPSPEDAAPSPEDAARSPDGDATADITTLLKHAGGDSAAASELYRRVHETLQRIARRRMRRERSDHTLQATALVHEAWIRLLGDQPVDWSDRAKFYAAAAESMRRILIDHARRRGAARRGGDRRRLPASLVDLAAQDDAERILAIDDAISQLEREEPDVAAVVRLRFYAGLTIDEVAAALGQSPRQVDRLWSYARARLYRDLSPDD